MLSIKRILCPVDFFPASHKAIRYAMDLAADYGASIHLLNVVAPVIPLADEYAINTAGIVQSVEQAATSQMKTLLSGLDTHGLEVTSEVRIGDVHQVIKQVISAVKPDIVVMGTYARSGLERFFMGSVAEWLTRNSPVPVLVISEKQKQRPANKRRPARHSA